MIKRMVLVSLFALLALSGSRAQGEQEPKPDAASGSTQSPPASSGSIVQRSAEGNPGNTRLSSAPETIKGSIMMVVRRDGLLVLTLNAKTPPKTISVESKNYDSIDGKRTVHHKVTTTVLQSEDVDYDFRVTHSTAIWMAGKQVGLAELEGLKNKQATVRFKAQAAGDFAELIQIQIR